MIIHIPVFTHIPSLVQQIPLEVERDIDRERGHCRIYRWSAEMVVLVLAVGSFQVYKQFLRDIPLHELTK